MDAFGLRGAACPCGTGSSYANCCRPLHLGAVQAETAEQLMRARYAAFAKQVPAFLARSWHPRTRPDDGLGAAGTSWEGLTVLATEAGGPDDTEGTVTFRVRLRDAAGPRQFKEHSRFTRHAGRWVYVDGAVTPLD